MSESIIGIPDAVATESLSHADTDMTIREVAGDLQEAHRELDEYRSSSLVLAQNLKELRMKAEDNEKIPLANTTKELENAAMAVFERTRK